MGIISLYSSLTCKMVKIVQLPLFTRNIIFVTPRFSPYPSEQQQDALPTPLKLDVAMWLPMTNGNEHGGPKSLSGVTTFDGLA